MDDIINITPDSPKLNVIDTNDEGVIKLNITPMDNTQKSVNFGPGADLLMNQGRASRQNSPKSGIKLSDLNGLGSINTQPKISSVERSAMATNIDQSRKPVKITSTINNDTPRIYCTFQVTNAPIGTSVSAEWIFKGTSNVENHFIDSWTELVEGNKNMAMFMNRHPNGWPLGNYEVILYVDGEPQGSVPFKVK